MKEIKTASKLFRMNQGTEKNVGLNLSECLHVYIPSQKKKAQ